MYLCYIDESGTPDVPGNTSHFVLAGLSIPIWDWRNLDQAITGILAKYSLEHEELHTAWLLRPYLEQRRIPKFESLDWDARRAAVQRERNTQLLALQQSQRSKTYKQQKKTFAKTQPYIHLTHTERIALITEVADSVGAWKYARLFAECIDKLHFDQKKTGRTVGEQAFEQVVSRFEQYLRNLAKFQGPQTHGVLVHDHNETVSIKHTRMMRHFHQTGTLWTQVDRIIETPLFVDSELTRMVQIADHCAYSLRRYVENKETHLFRRIFPRADTVNGIAVGVRHFTTMKCTCEICHGHRQRIVRI